MENTIRIKRAILHILDKELGAPMLSSHFLDISTLEEYLSKHVQKAFSDEEIKQEKLLNIQPEISDDVFLCSNDPTFFMDWSKKYASVFFEIIQKYDLPSGDLLLVDFLQADHQFFGIYKMNYKKSYVHHVRQTPDVMNDIVCNKAALPSDGQKLDEFLIFNPAANSVSFKEKRYSLDGTMKTYISDLILGIQYIKSDKEKLKAMRHSLEKITTKYYPDDATVEMDYDNTIYHCYKEDGDIPIDKVAESVSRGIASIKEEFIQEVKQCGIEETRVTIHENLEKSIYKKHKITTEDGVEVKLPVEILKRKDKFEIINNPDGSLSMVIKNVSIVS